MRSLSAALEEAMKDSKNHSMKKAPKAKGGKGGLIHSSFPPQGSPQPNFMGSQSAPPGGMSGGMPTMGAPSGMPSMGEEPGAYGPGY